MLDPAFFFKLLKKNYKVQNSHFYHESLHYQDKASKIRVYIFHMSYAYTPSFSLLWPYILDTFWYFIPTIAYWGLLSSQVMIPLFLHLLWRFFRTKLQVNHNPLDYDDHVHTQNNSCVHSHTQHLQFNHHGLCRSCYSQYWGRILHFLGWVQKNRRDVSCKNCILSQSKVLKKFVKKRLLCMSRLDMRLLPRLVLTSTSLSNGIRSIPHIRNDHSLPSRLPMLYWLLHNSKDTL